MDITKAVKEMDGAAFGELQRLVTEETESRRRKPTLDTIKPGMSREDEAAVLAEIVTAMKGTAR